jgi:hypothetical protein
MDVTALIFYAIVCGLLSLAAPTVGKPVMRVAIGAIVGIAAAISCRSCASPSACPEGLALAPRLPITPLKLQRRPPWAS